MDAIRALRWHVRNGIVACGAILMGSLGGMLLPSHGYAFDIPLERDPQSYLILGNRSARIFNLGMEPPGCNVGVNCAGGSCGLLTANGAVIPQPGQFAADQACGGGTFFQVFRNTACPQPNCTMISHPGLSGDCTEPFGVPILGDLDGDSIPSCDAGCITDTDDIARACGVTLPLPACDPTRPVIAKVDRDCNIGDAEPGNNRCELLPGTYGAVRIAKGARLFFGVGTTVVCSLKASKATRTTSVGPATVLVPRRGSVKMNNSADLGSDCGVLRIVTEHGLVSLGKHSDHTVDLCSISGQIRLGHGNNLRGHFFADTVSTDKNNDGRCCPTTTTTTIPTTTTTGPTTTATTTTVPATTTTTVPGTTTTVSTTTGTTTSGPTTTGTTTTAPSITTVTATTTTGTTTSGPSTTAPTTTMTSTTGTSTSMSSTSTATTSSSTTTTISGGGFTRTPGFWKTHPTITQAVLNDAGGLFVCGHQITDVHVDHAHSALEVLCVEPVGDQRLQLFRQLLAAALNMAAGSPTFAQFAACDTVCQLPNSTTAQLSGCIESADAFNNSGDEAAAPFDPVGNADPTPCDLAYQTTCTGLEPSTCAAP